MHPYAAAGDSHHSGRPFNGLDDLRDQVFRRERGLPPVVDIPVRQQDRDAACPGKGFFNIGQFPSVIPWDLPIRRRVVLPEKQAQFRVFPPALPAVLCRKLRKGRGQVNILPDLLDPFVAYCGRGVEAAEGHPFCAGIAGIRRVKEGKLAVVRGGGKSVEDHGAHRLQRAGFRKIVPFRIDPDVGDAFLKLQLGVVLLQHLHMPRRILLLKTPPGAAGDAPLGNLRGANAVDVQIRAGQRLPDKL